jgi:sulfur carrier protein ThiS
MKITLKLFASLSDYLPPGARDNRIDLEVADQASIADILGPLNLPERLVHLVLINGTYVAPAARAGRLLSEGDQLGIWPPIAGG